MLWKWANRHPWYASGIAFFLLAYFGLVIWGLCEFGLPVRMGVEALATAPKMGFWAGVIHGMFITISFIASFFYDNHTIWAVNNTGFMYDFGFMVGVLALFNTGRDRK